MSRRFRDIIAIYARHEETGRIEHHEWFDATGVSTSESVRWTSRRTDDLFKEFDPEQYDVYEEEYDSLATMLGSHPILRTIPRQEDMRRQLVAFFTRGLATAHIERLEVIDWTNVPGDELADLIDARMIELKATCIADECEVFWEGYDSESSMLRGRPDRHVRRTILG